MSRNQQFFLPIKNFFNVLGCENARISSLYYFPPLGYMHDSYNGVKIQVFGLQAQKYADHACWGWIKKR